MHRNHHLKSGMKKAGRALDTLDSMGLLVLDVDINGSVPRIGVQAGAGCCRLKATSSRYTQQAGRRMVEKLAAVEGCQVVWQQPAGN